MRSTGQTTAVLLRSLRIGAPRFICLVIALAGLHGCTGESIPVAPDQFPMTGWWYYSMVARSADGSACCEFHTLFTVITHHSADTFSGTVSGNGFHHNGCHVHDVNQSIGIFSGTVNGSITTGDSLNFRLSSITGAECRHSGPLGRDSVFGSVTMLHDFAGDVGELTLSGSWYMKRRATPGVEERVCW